MSAFTDFFSGLFNKESQYPQSAIDVEAGMSLPTTDPNQTSIADASKAVEELSAGVTQPSSPFEALTGEKPFVDIKADKVDPTAGAITQQNELMAASMAKARGYQKLGQAAGAFSDAGALFSDIVNWGSQRRTNELARSNTELAADNQIQALENQALYTKNRLNAQFNELTARTAVATAAKGMAVSASSILEQNKETAHNINVDFRTLESNVKLNEIALTNAKEQAKIAEKLNNQLQIANIVSDAGKLTMSVSGSFFGGYDKLAGQFNKWFPTKTGVN